MAELFELTATEAVRRMRAGEITAEALARSCLERVTARDGQVHAWAHLDPALVIAQAKAIDASGQDGPIKGLPVAVKDIIDTADMPTACGSKIYAGFRPNADARCVSATRAAGGIIFGKAVSTEFAWRNPGPTTNPHNPAYSPGGSSSGSAAAVADRQSMLGFGTQTGGSVIRPAAYCGCVGLKPTVGTHSTVGVKELSRYLDTVGTYGRTVADVALFDYALRGQPVPDLAAFAAAPPKFGLVVAFRDSAQPAAVARLEETAGMAAKAGASVVTRGDADAFERLADLQSIIQVVEGGRALAHEYDHHAGMLTRYYRENIALGRAVSDEVLAGSRAEADAARRAMVALFDGVDAVLTLSSPGEAPHGLESTGDALFNKVWTLLGYPCVNVPAGFGPNGLPLGVQVVARPGDDGRALAAAAWVERLLG